MTDLLGWLLDWVESVDPVLRTLLAGVAIMLETSILIGLIVPGDTIVILSSLGITDVWQYLGLLVAVLLGALVGESIGFALGRFFGPRIRRSWLGRRIGEERWLRADAYLERRGGIAVFLSRFLPVLHSLIPVTVGMSRMRYRTFIAWTLPACLLWSVLYATAGWLAADVFRANRKALSDQLHLASAAFVGIILLLIGTVALVKRVLMKREERFMRLPQPEAGSADADDATGSAPAGERATDRH